MASFCLGTTRGREREREIISYRFRLHLNTDENLKTLNFGPVSHGQGIVVGSSGVTYFENRGKTSSFLK